MRMPLSPSRAGGSPRISIAFLLACLAAGAAAARALGAQETEAAKPEERAAPPRIRNIVLMIGDGMGLAQISLARLHKGPLWLETAERFGFVVTSARDYLVTDSSASATALASGYLIFNGQVGIHPDGTPTKTILEHAEERGMWTGLVATSRITHATPASMATHVRSRDNEDEIALQMSALDIEVILGGGWDKFLPRPEADVRAPASEADDAPRVARLPAALGLVAWCVSGGRGGSILGLALAAQTVDYAKLSGTRKDGKNLLAEMRRRGYRVIHTAAELSGAVNGPPRKLIGLFATGPMPKITEGRSPTLAAMAHGALTLLAQSPQGFFLMIEGSQVDWGGHDKNAAYAMHEAADFDDAVGAVLRFLKDRGLERDTLIVATADHETGGLSLNKHAALPLGVDPKFTTDYHTAIPVPLFSWGPRSEKFTGFRTHWQIGRDLIEGLLDRRLEWEYPARR